MLWILAVGWMGVMVSHAQILRTIVEFGAVTGRTNASTGYPTELTQSSDGTLYGTTASTVFTVQPDGSGFAVLKWLTNSVEGRFPLGGLVLSEGTLYGTTTNGGSSDKGTVYRLKTDGSDFTVLKGFSALEGGMRTNWDGANPHAGLVLSGNTLYGTAILGGTSGSGTVFKLNTDGTDFSVLRHASLGDGESHAGLEVSGSTLYGTAWYGGNLHGGGVFRLNTDGTDYRWIHEFSVWEGLRTPLSKLVLSGPTLYGTARYGGGVSGGGGVFKVNTDGSGFEVLKWFTNYFEGADPRGGLVLSEGTLYGTTRTGGAAGLGTVFRLNVDGTGYTVMAQFTGDNGANPSFSLVLSDRTIYGTTAQGGQGNRGTVFQIELPGLPLVIRPVQGAVVLNWERSADVLQAAGDVAGTYTNVPGAASPYTNAPVMPRQFFRLMGP